MATEEIRIKIIEEAVGRLKGLISLQENLEKVKQGGKNVDKSLALVNKRIDKATGGAKGVSLQFKRFKFELLGVLFFGMAVTRFLQGLVKPALEVTGTFEVLNDHLTQFFIPTGEDTVEIVDAIGASLNELPNPIQRLIGWIFILVGFIGTIFFALATWGLGIRSIKTAFPKLIPKLATFFKWLKTLIFGVILLRFSKKKWLALIKKIGPALIILGGTLKKFGGFFIPVLRWVFLAMLAFDALKFIWKKLREELEKPGKVREVLRFVFNSWVEAINRVIDALNRIPFVNIPRLDLAVGPKEVIDVSNQVSLPPGATPGGGFKVGDSFFNITINTTNGIDEVSLKDELKSFVNETFARETQNVSGNR